MLTWNSDPLFVPSALNICPYTPNKSPSWPLLIHVTTKSPLLKLATEENSWSFAVYELTWNSGPIFPTIVCLFNIEGISFVICFRLSFSVTNATSFLVNSPTSFSACLNISLDNNFLFGLSWEFCNSWSTCPKGVFASKSLFINVSLRDVSSLTKFKKVCSCSCNNLFTRFSILAVSMSLYFLWTRPK